MSNNYGSGYLAGIANGLVIALMLTSGGRTLPRNNVVERDYVIPTGLEIKVEDLDKNGTNETIAVYNGTNYLFRVDESGKPYFTAYEIKSESQKIVPL